MITESEIDERLKRLRGKVPNFLIDDLRERLLKKKDVLTPDQVDKVVDKVLETYSGQIEKLSRLNSRVDEIGRYLEEIRSHLLNLQGSGQVPSAQPLTGPVGDDKGDQGSEKGEAHGQEFDKAEDAPGAVEVSERPPLKDAGVGTPAPPIERNVEVGSMDQTFEIPPDIKDVLISAPSSRARLEKIPSDMMSTMMTLKWLGFLLERVGMQNLEDVLEFYYQIGWISEDVLNTLLRYAEGIRPHHRDPDWRPDEKLTIQDHLVSLLFIERLRGVRITREVMDSIEREMRVINRLLEDIYGV